MKTKEFQYILSIITVNLNNKCGLQKTIDSVIAQTYKDFEWIIIDGGSTDGSKELIEKYGNYISHWVSEPDKGIYNGMNKGITVSNGEYLLFMNSGDKIYDENVLTRTIPLLLGEDYYVGDQYFSGTILRPNLSAVGHLCNILTFSYIPHQSTFIHRKIFNKYGLYREDLQIVSDWWLFYNSILLDNAIVERLPFVVSEFEGNGISSTPIGMEEIHQLLSTKPRIQYLAQFYKDNSELIESIRAKRWIFFLFRAYYFLYRKWIKK